MRYFTPHVSPKGEVVSGAYDGEFNGHKLLAYHVSHGSGNGSLFMLEFTGYAGNSKQPVAYVQSKAHADDTLDWLAAQDYTVPVKLLKVDRVWTWCGHALVPQDTSNPQQGASDYVIQNAPHYVSFYRLGNARSFLSLLKK